MRVNFKRPAKTDETHLNELSVILIDRLKECHDPK